MTEYRVTSVSLTMTLADSTTLNIGDSDIILGSLSVNEASSGSTEFSIGTAIAKRLSFQLKNFNDEYSAYDFNDAQIVATIIADADSTVDEANGIVSGFGGTMGSDSVVTLTGASMDDNGIVTMSGSSTTDNYTLGVFYVVEKPNYNGGTITFNALDGLYKTDRDYTTALTFPATLLQIYNELCTNCGIVPAQATIPNANYSVPVKPNLDAVTAADMLCYIAQVSGTFAQMNSQGKLELKRYGGTSHSLSETFSMEVDTDDVVITGVKVTECFDETDTMKRQTVLNGTAAYALTIAENQLIGSGKAQAVADFLTGVYVGMQFRPLRITVPTNPEVHVGDSIVFTDYKGNTYSTYATEVDFSTNAPTTIAMNAASPERNSAVRYSAEAKALAESKRLVENEKTARELAIDQIAQQIAGAGGMYETTVAQTGGGNIYYLHNKPTLAESTTILRIDDTGIYISNDGGQTYPIGLDYSGTEILDKIYAIGINADYITTGLIQSAVSGFSLNMDTGVANLSNVNITGGTISVNTTNLDDNFIRAHWEGEIPVGATGENTIYQTDDAEMSPLSFQMSSVDYDQRGGTIQTSRILSWLNQEGILQIFEKDSSSTNTFSVQDGYVRLNKDGTDYITMYASATHGIQGGVKASDGVLRPRYLLNGQGVGFYNDNNKYVSYLNKDSLSLSYDGAHSGVLLSKSGLSLYDTSANGIQRVSLTSTAVLSLKDSNQSDKIVLDSANNLIMSAGLVSSLTAVGARMFKNGIAFTNPATRNDQGWMRVLGTGESDTVLEIATGDDGGSGEQIVVRQYNTSNAVARQAVLLNTSGNTTFPGELSAAKLSWGGHETIRYIGIASDISTDFNNVTTPGFYALNGTTMSNGPAAYTWGSMIVVESGWPVQVVFNGGSIYSRKKSGNPATWGGWTAFANSNVTPSANTTNTNGYIRFPNVKVQIAWKQTTVSTKWETAWNSLYESSLIDVGNWAAAFSARPASAAAAFGNGNTRGAMFESNTGATASHAGKYYLVNTGKITTAASMVVTVIAIGPYA